MYKPTMSSVMAKTTRDRYESVLKNYLVPAFDSSCLTELGVALGHLDIGVPKILAKRFAPPKTAGYLRNSEASSGGMGHIGRNPL